MRFAEVLDIRNGRNQRQVENKNGKYPIYGSGGIMGRADDFLCEAETVVIGRKGSINNPIYVDEPFWNVDTAFGLVAHKDVLLPKYLYYFCVNFDFEKLNTTVTIPSLTKANLLQIEISIPDMDKQRYIVGVLDRVCHLIELRQQELRELDQLVKSRFIELFGMPGADDFGWGLVPLGSVCYINPKKGQDPRLSSGVEVSFVPMPAVTERGEIDATAIKEYDEVKTGFTYFAENDVLFAKITPCMENGKGAVARGLRNGLGFGSTEFHVLRPISGKSNPYWVYTLTAFSQFREDAASNMTGSAGQRRVPASFLENYPVALPPLALQEQFAAFVEQTDKSKYYSSLSCYLCNKAANTYRQEWTKCQTSNS